LGGLFSALRLSQAPIPINLGDLVTAYARKRDHVPA